MPPIKSVINLLDKNKIKYEVVEHRKVFTAWDLSQTKHIRPTQVVKTLILKADNSVFMAALPASKLADFNKIKKILNAYLKKSGKKAVKKISLVKEAWMKKNIAGNIGATPPFVLLLPGRKEEKPPLITDVPIFKESQVLINSGDYKIALKVRPGVLLKIQEVLKGNISKKR